MRRGVVRGRALSLGMTLLVLLTVRALASEEYQVGPADVLSITVWNHEDLARRVTVSANGFISLPLVGDVLAEGLTKSQLEEKLANLYAVYIKSPRIVVDIAEYRSKKVYVLGSIRSPGAYTLGGNATLIELLSLAGGPSQDAGAEVQVVREEKGGGSKISSFNLNQALSGGEAARLILQDGDIINLPRASFVQVLGQVQRPGPVPLTEGLTALEAVTRAGGFTDRASRNRVKVLRTKADGKQMTLKVPLGKVLEGGRKDQDVLLEPNDVVVVPERIL